MTHIIQSPKPRKRGATFADVPIAADKDDMRALFLNGAGCILQRCGKRWAREFGLEQRYEYGLGDQATPLSVQPIDPKPDPDVCTYGELEPGEWFEWSAGPLALHKGAHLRLESGWLHVRHGVQWAHAEADHPVHPVSASVVEHEEPGGQWVKPAHRGHFAYVNGSPADRETLATIVRQGAALLAQQAASSESGEPLVDGGDGEGYCPVCDTEQEGYPCLHSASEVAAVKMPEPRKQRDHETCIARAAIAERNAARAALNELHSEVVEIAENPLRGPDGQKAASDVLELLEDALAREDGAG